MSLNTVTLICDLYDGTGSPVTTGQISFIPNVTLTDTAGHVVLTRAPVIIQLLRNPLPQVTLYATDSTDLSPAGWAWEFSGTFPGCPPPATYFLPFASGATQYLSQLLPATDAPVAFTPIAVSGIPSTGQVITATSPIAAEWENPSGGTPSGAAGGSLAGSYPNPTLAATAVTAGSYTATNLTVAADGRITAAANGSTAGISLTGGDLGGTTSVPKVTGIQGTPIPSLPGGTASFLRADATWAIPPGTGGGGGGGGVAAVAAADASIVVTGTGTNPAVATGTLDVIAVQHPPAAAWSNNSKKITSVASGTTTGEAVHFGQLPSSGAPLSLAQGGTATSAASNAALLTALGAAGLAAPVFTGNPTAVTQTAGNNSTRLATTAYVDTAAAMAIPKAGGTMTGALIPSVVALTDASTVALNAALGNQFVLTATSGIGATRQLGTPTGAVDGQTILVDFIQDATGGRALTFSAAWDFGTASAPAVFSTGANKIDTLAFRYKSVISKWCYLSTPFPQGY